MLNWSSGQRWGAIVDFADNSANNWRFHAASNLYGASRSNFKLIRSFDAPRAGISFP